MVETVFDRLNTSLKIFIFVCSQEVRPETVFYLNFIRTNFVSLCLLWLKLCSIGRTRVFEEFHFCVQSGRPETVFTFHFKNELGVC